MARECSCTTGKCNPIEAAAPLPFSKKKGPLLTLFFGACLKEENTSAP
jgi:hypothetical protein